MTPDSFLNLINMKHGDQSYLHTVCRRYNLIKKTYKGKSKYNISKPTKTNELKVKFMKLNIKMFS